jgi:hypothetical protein
MWAILEIVLERDGAQLAGAPHATANPATLNIAIAFLVGLVIGAVVWDWVNRWPTAFRADAPTLRQRRYAKFLGIAVPHGCTRQQLSAIIERFARG